MMANSNHKVVSHQDWYAARKALLVQEKELMKLMDKLSQQRRELPWERVEKTYIFDGPAGQETLADLFGKCSQLAVYHFMFAPEWDEGCKHCSFWADNFNGTDIHLKHRDVTLVAISRAPLGKLEQFKRRMGWNFKWVSSGNTDFNYDYRVSATPQELAAGEYEHNYEMQKNTLTDQVGISAFCKDADGAVFHTYSAYGRGVEPINGAYHFLDLMPKGRDEDALPFKQSWVRHHDRYED
jgi:predicted dithiol-disulfide oxidoreductase (DUF899 family)